MMDVQAVYLKLSEGGPRELSLDEIGEAIGTAFAEVTRVGELFDLLERSGYSISVATEVSLGELLMVVLNAARQSRASGRKPSIDELAALTRISPREVRVALLYGEVLSRGRAARG